MLDGRVRGLAQELAEPRHAFALHDVVGVDHVLRRPGSPPRARRRRSCECGECSRTRRHISRTLPTFTMMLEMPTMSYWWACQFLDEALAGGEVEHRAGRGDVVLDEDDAPRPVEHAQRERALLARHLVVVELHRVDRPAAELVVLGVGTEHGREQDARAGALRMLLRLGVASNGFLAEEPLEPAAFRSRSGTLTTPAERERKYPP